MDFQQIIVSVIVASAIVFTIYSFVKTIFKKDKNASSCGTCPYSTKEGACTKN